MPARLVLALVLWLTAGTSVAVAHPAPFSYLDLHVTPQGLSGTLVVHDLDAAFELQIPQSEAHTLLDLDVARRHQGALVAALTRRLHLRLDGRATVVTLADVEPVPDRQGLRFSVRAVGSGGPGRVDLDTMLFPYDATHQTFVSIYDGGQLRQQSVLDARSTTLTYYSGSWQGATAVLATFIPSGAHHIAIGPDHLLFLLGLLLPGGRVRRLVAIVTAFTLGHSITLSLAALGVLTPPASIVEPLIALSIVLVGVDNLLVGDGVASSRDLRPWLAGLFGLIHGFGFASVLAELGLPREALGWSLLGFNLGVELGQLAFVIPVAAALAWLRRRSPLAGTRVAMVGSVLVALAGTWWFVQRVFFPESAA